METEGGGRTEGGADVCGVRVCVCRARVRMHVSSVCALCGTMILATPTIHRSCLPGEPGEGEEADRRQFDSSNSR